MSLVNAYREDFSVRLRVWRRRTGGGGLKGRDGGSRRRVRSRKKRENEERDEELSVFLNEGRTASQSFIHVVLRPAPQRLAF